MEYWLDERHAQILFAPSYPSQVRAQQGYFLTSLGFYGKLSSSLLPRRSRPRQKFSPPQNARRHVAAIRQSPPSLRLSVRPSRQKTPLHGPGIRPAPRMDRSAQPGLGLASARLSSRHSASHQRSEPSLRN